MQVDKTKENACNCLCIMCPSYEKACEPAKQDVSTTDLQNIKHYEKMFCAFEKSNCIHIDRGCLCQNCEVFKKYGLRHKEYCLKTGGI